MKFYGNVNNKVLTIYQKDLFNKFIEKTSGEIEINIKKRGSSRSIPQNKLYWMWLQIIQDDTGQDADDLHLGFKVKFLTDNTSLIPKVRSTASLNKQEFTEYLEKIKLFSIDFLNINLPEPSEIYE